MNFDMNSCWARAVELVERNFSLLIVIAGTLVLLPTVALYFLMPDMQMLANPTTDQSVIEERMGEILLPFFGAMFVLSLFQFAGQSAMVALMGDDRPTVGQALGQGIKAVPSLVAVMLIFFASFMIGTSVFLIPVSLIAGALGSEAMVLVFIPVILIAMAWLMARLSMTLPALVLGETLNPITAMTSSFRLTGPKQWQILLFWVVLYVVIVIINLLVGGLVGVLAALIGPGTTGLAISGIANGLIGALISMLFCAIAVAMYGQLAGAGEAEIRDTFD